MEDNRFGEGLGELDLDDEATLLQLEAETMEGLSMDPSFPGFVSEYTYSDGDTQYERRRSLERHSSTDVTDIPIVKLAQTHTKDSLVSYRYVQSLFKGLYWVDDRKLSLENLIKITDPVEAVEALRKAAEQKNVEYTTSALDLTTHLCESDRSKQTSRNLIDCGAATPIGRILGTHNAHSQGAWGGGGGGGGVEGEEDPAAVASVAANRRAFSSAGLVYRIVKAASHHAADEITLEWGLRVVFYLSLEQGLVLRIVSCGGCDLLASALRAHAGSDDILVWACRTLCHCVLTLDVVSAQARSACQDKLAAQDVPEILVSELAERGQQGGQGLSELATMWVLKAIGALARRHPRTLALFVEIGVCELLQSVVRRHSLGERLAESVCWVVGNLSYPSREAQLRWGACGACHVVLASLQQNAHSEETVQEALRALRNLCFDNGPNLEEARQRGSAALLLQVMVLHRYQASSGLVLQWLWYCIAALAPHRPTALALGRDVCIAAVDSLTRFSDRPDLVQWAALAVAGLAADSRLAEALGGAGACGVLTRVLGQHSADSDVVEEVLAAMGALTLTVSNRR
ncbi:armadillo-type protein, partial [Ochromonadaceae sp. CCMP2298]